MDGRGNTGIEPCLAATAAGVYGRFIEANRGREKNEERAEHRCSKSADSCSREGWESGRGAGAGKVEAEALVATARVNCETAVLPPLRRIKGGRITSTSQQAKEPKRVTKQARRWSYNSNECVVGRK